MRPRGEIRQALAGAVRDLVSGGRPSVCFRDAAAVAQVGYDAARSTMREMARAGELTVLGTTRVEGVSRPVLAYGWPERPQAPAALEAAVRSFADFV